MNLEIKKHRENKGFFFDKSPRVGQSKTKSLAMKDIANEIQENSKDFFYPMNLLSIESRLLRYINTMKQGFNFEKSVF